MSEYPRYTPTGQNNPFEWDLDGDGGVESPEHIEAGGAYIEGLADGFDHHALLGNTGDLDPDGSDPSADLEERLQTEWDNLDEYERWLLAGGVAAVVFASVLVVGAGSRPGPQGPGGS